LPHRFALKLGLIGKQQHGKTVCNDETVVILNAVKDLTVPPLRFFACGKCPLGYQNDKSFKVLTL